MMKTVLQDSQMCDTHVTTQRGASHVLSMLVEGVTHCALSKPSSLKCVVFMADTKDVNVSHRIGNMTCVCILSAADAIAPVCHPKVLHQINSHKASALLGTQKGSGGLHKVAICLPQQQTEFTTTVLLTQHPSPGFASGRQGQDGEAPQGEQQPRRRTWSGGFPKKQLHPIKGC